MYKPLLACDLVRLLRLAPSPHRDDPLTGNFVVISLKHAPSFEAISYVWGDPTISESIRIDSDTDDISITPNLASALRQFRTRDKARMLWADGICIDQGNNDEKALQVPMMADIYRTASGVLAWMGKGDHNRQEAFARMLQLGNSSSQSIEKDNQSDNASDTIPDQETDEKTDDKPDNKPDEQPTSSEEITRTPGAGEIGIETWKYVDCILGDVWFTRLWIVQEAVLARDLRLFYGNQDTSWNNFQKSIDVYVIRKPRSIRLSKEASKGLRFINHLNKARRDMAMQYGVRQNLQNLNLNSWLSSSLSSPFIDHFLERIRTQNSSLPGQPTTILNMSRGSHFSDMFWSLTSRNCKDDRDRVYAMLGFLPWDVPIKIKPNYSFSIKRVYTDFARAMFELHYIELLVYAGLWDRLPVDDDMKTHECPSWVPELRPSKLKSGTMNAWDHQMLDYAIKNLETPKVEWLSFYKIRIEGIIFDKIVHVEAPPESIEHNEGLIYALRHYFNALAQLGDLNKGFDALMQNYGKLLAVLPSELGTDGRDDPEDMDRLATLLLGDAQEILAVFEEGQRRYFENTLPAEQLAALGKMFELTVFLRKRLSHRKLFVSEKGECGLAPLMVEPGDSLVRFMGQGVECLIRGVPNSQDWHLIGSCYYHAVSKFETMPEMIALI